MKKYLLPITFFAGVAAYSQVGIGTPAPNPSAQLEVVSNSKGLLIPQVALTSLTDASTITNGNVESLTVFNTNTTLTVSPGYYYWYNSKWNRIVNQDDIAVFSPDTTNVSFDVVGTDLVITDSAGGIVQVPLADIAAGVDTDNQTITNFSVIGTDLSITIEDGNTVTVPLASIAAADTNTTNVSLTEDGVNVILTDSDGGTVTLALADIAAGVDTNTTNVSLTEDGTDIILTDSEGNTITLALADIAAGVDTNTTNVSLTEDGINIILTDSDGGTVSLSLADIAAGVDTNTTNVSFAIVGTNLVITDSDGANVAVALADIATGVNTDDQTITDFSIVGTNLSITIEDGNTAIIPLATIAAGINTDDQTLSLLGTVLQIEDGNSVDLGPVIAAAEVDGDVTNELNTNFAVVGTDLQITDAGGTLSIPLATIAAGVDTDTTNANFAVVGTDLVITDSAGGTVQVALADIAAGVNTDDQTLSLLGTVLQIEDGNSVDLGPVIAAAEVDGDVTNELNTNFAVVGTDLQITDAGGTLSVPLATIAAGVDTDTTNANFAVVGTDLVITDSAGGTVQVALTDIAAGVNTDDQTLSLLGTVLQIEDGNSVDLGPVIAAGEVDGDVTNELNTNFAVVGTDLQITDAGGTLSVPLATIAAGVDTDTTNANFAVVGTDLVITDSAGGTVQVALADIAAGVNTDDQTLSLLGTVLQIEDGNNVDLGPVIAAGEVDGDVTNELNTNFAVVGTDLQITDAGGTLSIPLATIAAGVDTDDQTITAFEVVGSNLSITLEDGNTATVALADITAALSGDGNITSGTITVGGDTNALLGDVTLEVDPTAITGDGTLTTTSAAVAIGGTPTNSLLEDVSIDVTTVSAAAGNLITAAGVDGGAFLDATALTGAETTTNLAQAGTGVITYTNEDGVVQTADVISGDAGNIVTAGADGGAFLDATALAANETTTNLAQDLGTGVVTYTNEDGVAQTANLVGAEGDNIVVSGANGGVYLSPTALTGAETTTNLAQAATGVITYTNEDGVAQTADVISGDAGNIVTAGTDGGSFMDAAALAAAETTTNLAQDLGTGVITYTNEDAVAQTANLVGAEGDNIVVSGANGGVYLSPTALTGAETTTNLAQAATGVITYTNEDGVAQTADVIGGTAGNIITADAANGGAFLNAAALAAAETTTNLAQDLGTGVITYTNEDGVAQTANLVGAEGDNIVVSGANGGVYLSPTALTGAETTTNLAQAATGVITYTNEDGVAQTADVISGDAGNIIAAGADGGSFMDAAALAAAETTTNLAQAATGVITYTNEDGVAQTADVIGGTAGNIIVADAANGGAFLDAAALAAAETTTTMTQAATGVITYTNEDATVTTADVVSADAGNIVTAGADGGSFMDAAALAAAETTTNMTQALATGVVTYTNEDGVAQTANLVGAEGDNIVVSGANGGVYLSPTALTGAETTTNLSQAATGVITYTNEDGVAQTADVISGDAGNIIAAGADGGSFMDAAALAAAETTTNLVQAATGVITYTNEDGVAQTADVIGGTAGNIIVADAANGGAFLDAAALAAAETTTTMTQAATGVITYTNEDATVTTADVVSADAGNIVTAGADGGSFMDAAALAAAETTTNMTQALATGVVTYTNEDGVAQTANLVGAEGDNIVVSGANGGVYLSPTALTGAETTTNLAQAATGVITYTNEDGVAQTADVIGGTAGNIIVADAANGGAFLDAAALAAAETTTNLAQDLGTGVITYTNEDGAAQTATLIGAEGDNIVVSGANGGVYLSNTAFLAAETTTTMTQAATGVITYTNEDATVTTADVVSADAGNIIAAGTDGGAFVTAATLGGDGTLTTTSAAVTIAGTPVNALLEDVSIDVTTVSANAGNIVTAGTDGGSFMDAAALAAAETTTNLSQAATGVITYTNEDGVAQTADVIGGTAGNIIVADAANGGAFLDATALAAAETTTNMTQALATGVVTYTNEDGVAQTANLVGAEGDNIVVSGANGGVYLSPTALTGAETTTNLAQAATGVITYTNEDGVAQTADVIGGTGGNIITADAANGGAFLDATALAAAETTTNMTQALATGVVTYTNEDGVAQTANLVGAEGDNIVVSGANGGVYLSPTALTGAETTTNLSQAATGVITYTNEDGVAQTADVIGGTAGNIIVADAANGGAFLDATALAAAETTTNLAQDLGTGVITYTNEDAVAQTANLVGAEGDNIVVSGANGGVYLSPTALTGAETTTTMTQAATGIITYTNEDATVTTADVVSTDAGNIVTAGADGGSFMDAAALAAAETTTTMTQAATGIITYTNEDATVTTADVVSADAGNIIAAGADGGSFMDAAALAAAETTTTMTQAATGIITYTNEDATVTTADVVSTDAGNIIAAGADGGSFMDAAALAAAETTTTMTQAATGIITYTNEDATVTTADVVSIDAGNIIAAGADGGSFMDAAALAAAETTTTMTQAATGIITYTNEDATVTTADVVSTDAGNIVTAGADGGAFVNAAGLAGDGTLTTTSAAVTIAGTPANSLLEDVSIDVLTVSADAGNVITAGTDGGAFLDPAATNTSTLTQAAAHTDTEVTGGTANTIGTHDPDGAGALPAVTINETVTTTTQDNATGIITFTDEAGTATTADAAGLNVVALAPNGTPAIANNAIKVGADGGAYINPVSKIVFSAEYSGASLFADGSDNLGVLTSDNTNSAATSFMNFYEWSSAEATAQDYDVMLRFTVPTDFTSWDAVNAIVIDYQAETGTSLRFDIFKEDGTALVINSTPAVTGTWTTTPIAGGVLTTLVAGETAIIRLKLISAPGDDTRKIRVGDVTLNYLK